MVMPSHRPIDFVSMTIRFDPPRRGRKLPGFDLTCQRCGDSFHTKQRQQRYCSLSCANRARVSAERVALAHTVITCARVRCAKRFTPLRVNQKYCSQDCGKANDARPMPAAVEPMEYAPNKCSQPIRGNRCGQVMLGQVTRDGLMVFWCTKHGEQAVPRILPGDPAHPAQREVKRGRPSKSVTHTRAA